MATCVHTRTTNILKISVVFISCPEMFYFKRELRLSRLKKYNKSGFGHENLIFDGWNISEHQWDWWASHLIFQTNFHLFSSLFTRQNGDHAPQIIFSPERETVHVHRIFGDFLLCMIYEQENEFYPPFFFSFVLFSTHRISQL